MPLTLPSPQGEGILADALVLNLDSIPFDRRGRKLQRRNACNQRGREETLSFGRGQGEGHCELLVYFQNYKSQILIYAEGCIRPCILAIEPGQFPRKF